MIRIVMISIELAMDSEEAMYMEFILAIKDVEKYIREMADNGDCTG